MIERDCNASDDEEIPESSELLLDSARGVYIPQNFAEIIIRECVEGVDDEDWDCLEEGPDGDYYWETWEGVLNNAQITNHDSGQKYFLHHDGDLWLVPVPEEVPTPKEVVKQMYEALQVAHAYLMHGPVDATHTPAFEIVEEALQAYRKGECVPRLEGKSDG